MNKKIILGFVAVLLLATLFFVGTKSPDATEKNKIVGNTVLSDFQSEACFSAAQAGTCNKLENLDLVTKEECCKKLDKCC